MEPSTDFKADPSVTFSQKASEASLANSRKKGTLSGQALLRGENTDLDRETQRTHSPQWVVRSGVGTGGVTAARVEEVGVVSSTI